MPTTYLMRASAVTAFACLCVASAGAQQPIPLDLPEATQLRAAVTDHPLMVSAEARVRAAEARMGAARWSRAPASLFFDADELAMSDVASANVIAGIEREFIPSAERRAELAAATAEHVATIAGRDGVRLHLESRVNRAFLEAIVHTRVIGRLVQEDTLLQRAEVTLNSRFSVGQARYIDVIRLRTERLRVQADLLQAQAQASRALLELAALTGRDVSVADIPTRPLNLPRVPENLDSLIAYAPAMRMATVDQDRLRAALQTASARRARRVTAQLGVQRFSSDAGGATIGPVVGASVSLPFTNRRSVQLAMEAAALDTIAGSARSRATRNTLQAEIGAAARQIAAVASRVSGVDQQLVNAAYEERQAALTSYANGELTLVELLDFERSLSRSETQLLQSFHVAIDAYDRINQLLAGVAPSGDAH